MKCALTKWKVYITNTFFVLFVLQDLKTKVSVDTSPIMLVLIVCFERFENNSFMCVMKSFF